MNIRTGMTHPRIIDLDPDFMGFGRRDFNGFDAEVGACFPCDGGLVCGRLY